MNWVYQEFIFMLYMNIKTCYQLRYSVNKDKVFFLSFFYRLWLIKRIQRNCKLEAVLWKKNGILNKLFKEQTCFFFIDSTLYITFRNTFRYNFSFNDINIGNKDYEVIFRTLDFLPRRKWYFTQINCYIKHSNALAKIYMAKSQRSLCLFWQNLAPVQTIS